MIQCVVIDDNDESIKLAVRHIQAKPELELMATFNDAILGLQFIEASAVDLVFVDIQMPMLSGLELIYTLRAKQNFKLPHFILITGYSEYALESYNYGVTDYVLKPLTFKRFSIAVDKYIATIHNKPKSPIAENNANFFFAEVDGIKTRINCAEIAYIEGAGNYISIFKSPQRLVLHRTMNSIIDILDPQQFIRIHKSVLVAINQITGMRGNDLFITYNGNTVTLPIGGTYKKELMDRLKII
jgi:DNA-binding LytR/AlgR family response regulator